LVLRPRIEPQFLTLITLMAGVAVHDTLTALGVRSDIKWVNDVLVGGRKICGILAESTETPLGLAVIVGVGVNIRSSSFPPDIAEHATSLAAETGHDIAAVEVETALTGFLAYWYEVLCGKDGPDTIVRAWRQRSTYYDGKQVTVRIAKETIIGVTDGLELNGALRVRIADGTVRVVQAGDVERLRNEKESD
jgi:BirA family biotin operon repressor/biotin-[acetyl-CoA-carboxylase] ligase